jgi:aminoglycoside phosphotransferase (APT) family kinase protein
MSTEGRRIRRVADALSSLGIEPVGWAPIADPAAWSRTPRCFRIVTAGHGVVKARVMRGPHRALRAATLAAALGDERVPTPLGCVGSTTIERWVEGTDLASTPLRGPHVDAAADLLAAIHGFAGGDGRSRLPQSRSVARFGARAVRQAIGLADAGTLTRTEGVALSRVLTRGLPDRSGWGLTHNDLCGPNLVVRDTDGVLVTVDNELLVRGFFEYDVGRVWYRWPRPDWAERRFATRYRRARGGATPSSEELAAWQASAALAGAHLRHRLGAPNTDAVAALRRLLEVATADR